MKRSTSPVLLALFVAFSPQLMIAGSRPDPRLPVSGRPDTATARLHKVSATLAIPFVIAQATAYATTDTSRHLFTFDDASAMTSHLTQRLTAGRWVDCRRESYTRDAAHRMTMSSTDESTPTGVMQTTMRSQYAYAVTGDLLSLTREEYSSASGIWMTAFTWTMAYDQARNIILDETQYMADGATYYGIRYSYTRDAGGRELVLRTEVWDAGWQNEYRYTTSRDGQGNPLTEITEIWSGGAWTNRDRALKVYDGRQNLLTEEHDAWVNGQWQPRDKATMTYDSLNNVTSRLGQSDTTGTLTNRFREFNSYEGNLRVGQFRESWLSGTWVPERRWTNIYDSNGDRLSSVIQVWTGDSWANESRSLTEYTAGHRQTLDLNDRWIDGQWMRQYEHSWRYDATGNRTLAQFSWWSGGTQTGGYRATFTYSPTGSPLTCVNDGWKSGRWTPTDAWWGFTDSASVESSTLISGTGHNVYSFEGYRVELQTRMIGNSGDAPAAHQLQQNYPNPFNAETMIVYTLPRAGLTRLTVYDILGQEVARPVDEHQGPGTFIAHVNAGQLPSGAYFYVLSTGGFTEARKMIVVK